MNRRPLTMRLVALLSVLLLGGMSLGGVALGYECRCTGRTVWVATDHCHGPHGENCLEAGGAHGDNCGSLDENAEHHAAVQKDADGLPPAAAVLPSVAPVLVGVLPADPDVYRPAFAPGDLAQRAPCRPPPSIESARTVVLLI